MNILTIHWNAPHIEDIANALETLGHRTIPYSDTPRNFRSDPRFRKILTQLIQEESVGCIFSLQYFPILADVCSGLHLPYVSWCTQSPLPLTFHKSILHPTNYIFAYDSLMVSSLQQLGACHVFYLPLAFHPSACEGENAVENYTADITFVGSLHSADTSLAKFSQLSQSTLGYLDGILQAQQLVYGYHFLENLLTPEILAELADNLSITVQPNGLENLEYLCTNLFLSKILTKNERVSFIQKLEQYKSTESISNSLLDIRLYVPEDTSFADSLENQHEIQTYTDLLDIYRHSKINLNITSRTVQAAIPQKIFDVAGSGGFILSNYQIDMDTCFTEGTDYICYENEDDMLQKARYYLEHEEERKRIAGNAQNRVLKQHTWLNRTKEILDIVVL